MSADNFWIIRKDIHNFFVPLMGFASDEENPIVNSEAPRFNTIEEAIISVIKKECEYGIIIHSECYSNEPVELIANESGHYSGCPCDWDFLNRKAECTCEEIVKDWIIFVQPKSRKKLSKLVE